jgi:hypothetical protein
MKKLFLLIVSVFIITACDEEIPQKGVIQPEDYKEIYKTILDSPKMHDYLNLARTMQRDTIFLLSKNEFCFDCTIELDSAVVKFQNHDIDNEEWLRINIYELARTENGDYIATLFYPIQGLSLTTTLKKEGSDFRILNFKEIEY